MRALTMRVSLGLALSGLIGLALFARADRPPQPVNQTADERIAASQEGQLTTISTASWVGYPSFEQIVRKADLVVAAQVTATAAGRKVTDFTGTDVTPFTNVRLRILDVGKGSATPGDLITVEQYGGMYRPSHAIADSRLPQATVPPAAGPGVQPPPRVQIPDRDVLLELREDPLLKTGERVVLPLVWSAELNLYQRFASQGRFSIDDGGRVHPVLRDDPVVAPLDGISLGELLAVIRRVSV